MTALRWAACFLAAELALAAFLILHEGGWLGVPPWPVSIDFVSFYAAGKLALAGTPALAYDQAVHAALEQQVAPTRGDYVFFLYPPVFLLLCAPLALLPYRLAYVAWVGATGAAYIAVLAAIIGPGQRRWLIAALAFPATFWTICMGQNAFLNAALLGGGLHLLARRPAAAGLALGALCYKPHVALLVPVALLAGARWRALSAAAASCACLLGLSLLLFGTAPWQAYVTAAQGAESVYTTGRIALADFPTVLAALRALGTPLPAAYAAQAAAIAAMALLVAIVFHRTAAEHLRCAVLAAATLLAMPVLSFNDQIIAVLAGAWLLRDTAITPARTMEANMLRFAFPATLLAPLVAQLTRTPLGLLVDAGLLALLARRALATPGRAA